MSASRAPDGSLKPRKCEDLTNVQLRDWLATMFKAIDDNFKLLGDKTGMVLPMPMQMNINNQAMLGAD